MAYSNKHSKIKRLPPKLAIALSHKLGGGEAPKVVASGAGKVAENIIKLAEENDIPVQVDTELAPLLHQVEVGQYIPAELYESVAKLLAFLYRVNGRIK